MNKEVKKIIEKLKTRRPTLVPKKAWDSGLNDRIKKLDTPILAKAALYLWNDDVQKAHKIAQANPGPTGNLIHAILHRREPDYGNSKYWYDNIEEHPLYAEIRKEFSDWQPNDFVDWCEEAANGKGSKKREWLETVQARELELLTEHCLNDK